MQDNEMNKTIGAWLAAERQERGLSQQDVADILGVSKSAVHYWETGKRTIYAVNLLDYCRAINADPADCVNYVVGRMR